MPQLDENSNQKKLGRHPMRIMGAVRVDRFDQTKMAECGENRGKIM